MKLVNFLLMIISIFFIGRETPSVAGIINPGSEGFQKLFFGQEEIAIPVHSRLAHLFALNDFILLYVRLVK